MSFVQHQETSCWAHQFGKRTLRRQIHRRDSRTPSCFTANYLQCIWLATRDHMHPWSDSDIGVHEKWRTESPSVRRLPFSLQAGTGQTHMQ